LLRSRTRGGRSRVSLRRVPPALSFASFPGERLFSKKLKVEIDKKDCFPSVSSYTVAPYDGSTDVLLIDARSSRTAS